MQLHFLKRKKKKKNFHFRIDIFKDLHYLYHCHKRTLLCYIWLKELKV